MRKVILTVAILGASILSAGAAELPVKPGLWEVTSTNSMAMPGQPAQRVEQQCMADDTFNPREEFAGDNDECEIVDETLEGNTLSFTMNCPSDMGSSTAEASYTSNGDTMTGFMNMTMNMGGGQTMQMNMDFSGRWIGDC